MKNKAIFLVILCIVVILLISVLVWTNYITRNPSPIPNEILEHKNYKVVFVSYTNNNLNYETGYIVDSRQKVIDARQKVTGYNNEELNTVYNQLVNGPSYIYYNVEIKENSLLYNVAWNNNKTIDTILTDIKNDKNYTNLQINEL